MVPTGVEATRVFTGVRRIAAPDAITLICGVRADPKNAAETAALCYIALANIATASIDFTRQDSRGELPVSPANEHISPASIARLTT